MSASGPDSSARSADSPDAREGGFALLAALLVLICLSLLASLGMYVSRSDYEVSQNHESGVDAFYAANMGLDEYVATYDSANVDTTYKFQGGVAEVSGTKLLDLGVPGQALYRVTSIGTIAAPRGGRARRSVSAVAIRSLGSIRPQAAFIAGTPFRKNGGSGSFSGYNAGTEAGCSGSAFDVAGIALPTSGYTQMGGTARDGAIDGASAGPMTVSGTVSPEAGQATTAAGGVAEGRPAIDDSRDGIGQLRRSGVDWQGILEGSVVQADYNVSDGAWPSFSSMPADEWPVVEVDESETALRSPESGRGTLIVRGNLTLKGSFAWTGIVLVGGTLESDGKQTIRGLTVTGLNLLLGEPVDSLDVGNGDKVFQYDECAVMNAKKAFASLVREPQSWSEKL